MAAEPPSTGKPVKPLALTGRASALWDEYAPRLPWLGEQDSHALAVLCSLWAEWELDPLEMTAARLQQMRSLAAELGCTPSGRARMAPKGQDAQAQSPTARYFG